jgi:predicted N-acetyltransferase YhbS
MEIRIDSEKIFDVAAREALLDLSFGPSRRAKTCERLREGRLPAEGLAFVARLDDGVVGTLRLWHVAAGETPLLMLGPLAVHPLHRGDGLGARLMNRALAEATLRGHKGVFLVGDAPYYARFGFRRELARSLDLPGAVDLDRFLAAELQPGGLSGVRGMLRPTGAIPLFPEYSGEARGLRAVA